MTTEPLYTIREVATRLHLHPDTVRSWIEKGALKVIRIGPTQLIRIPESALQSLMSSNTPTRN